jgi:hypothetical protein
MANMATLSLRAIFGWLATFSFRRAMEKRDCISRRRLREEVAFPEHVEIEFEKKRPPGCGGHRLATPSRLPPPPVDYGKNLK